MKGFKMYKEIKQLKELRFSKSRTAKQLNISRETVSRYWDMSAEEFDDNLCSINRAQLLDNYKGIILNWSGQYPTMTAAQVRDWLEEHYKEKFKDRTVSRYVKEIRTQYNLLKTNHPREYEAVEDLPMGQQLQVDFGEKHMKAPNGSYVKVRFAAFVLANSRYKWGVFQTRPFTTVDLVNACKNCFSFFGGMPLELVFDQDSIVTVSENNGDIIHTYEFEGFRQEYDFKVYLCRKADPESKGKIESVVKFVKGNFVENRIFIDEDILNLSFLDWLERTGNGKIHSTTKKIPTDVFKEERDYLRGLPNKISNSSQIFRTVRKDNTILFDSNRYSVPLGTYGKHSEVSVESDGTTLTIKDAFGDAIICEHSISTGKGLLIKNSSHGRDRESSINELQNTLDELLLFKATSFLQEIRKTKSRYSRDQFGLLKSLSSTYGVDKVIGAVEYCIENRLYSANYVKDYIGKPDENIAKNIIPLSNNKYHVTTEKRDIAVYAKVGEQ